MIEDDKMQKFYLLGLLSCSQIIRFQKISVIDHSSHYSHLRFAADERSSSACKYATTGKTNKLININNIVHAYHLVH